MKLDYVYLELTQFCFTLKMKEKHVEVQFIIMGAGN